MKYWLFIYHNLAVTIFHAQLVLFILLSSNSDELIISLSGVMVTVLNSEFSWFTIMVWLVIWGSDWSSEWKPLKESSDLWSLVVWVNRKGEMIVNTIVEGSELPGLWVVEDVLLNLGIWSLVELIIFTLGSDESSIWSIIHFVGGISELGNMVEGLACLSVVN